MPKAKKKKKTKKAKYKDLSAKQQELLITLYDKHGGNLSEVSKDPEAPYKSRDHLTYYKKKYKLNDKLAQIRTERAKYVLNSLTDAKVLAIKRARELIQIREIEVPYRGKMIKVKKHPEYKEIVAAWEIIKTELGEPTKITKNNINPETPQLDEHISKLNNLIDYVKTSTPGSTGDNTESNTTPSEPV